MGLNRAVQERLRELAIEDPLTRKMRVHMSGCPNSCGQHHIADIGFHGAAIKVGNRQIPAYHMFIGGTYRNDEMRLGKLVPRVRIPAKRVPDAVERVIALYADDRLNASEEFDTWIDRVGPAPDSGRNERSDAADRLRAGDAADVRRLGPRGHLRAAARRG